MILAPPFDTTIRSLLVSKHFEARGRGERDARGCALDVKKENTFMRYGDRFIYHVYGTTGQENGSGGHMGD